MYMPLVGVYADSIFFCKFVWMVVCTAECDHVYASMCYGVHGCECNSATVCVGL